MNILALIGIAIGGAIGALSRGLLTRMLKRHLPEQFPFATLIVNLIACFAAGMVMPLTLNEALYLTLTVGFLGGFSTLATMNFEAVSLFATKRYKILLCLPGHHLREHAGRRSARLRTGKLLC